MDEMDHHMIRCQAFQNTRQPVTQCWDDYRHDGDHRWYSNDGWIHWPQTINLIERIVGRIGL